MIEKAEKKDQLDLMVTNPTREDLREAKKEKNQIESDLIPQMIPTLT